MKHIKKPVRMDDGAWPGDILDSDGVTICEMTEPMPFPMAQEIICAVNAYNDLIAQRKALAEACESARDALEHSVPGDCWATGPLTGDAIKDLVACPGCAALSAIDAVLALVRGEGERR